MASTGAPSPPIERPWMGWEGILAKRVPATPHCLGAAVPGEPPAWDEALGDTTCHRTPATSRDRGTFRSRSWVDFRR